VIETLQYRLALFPHLANDPLVGPETCIKATYKRSLSLAEKWLASSEDFSVRYICLPANQGKTAIARSLCLLAPTSTICLPAFILDDPDPATHLTAQEVLQLLIHRLAEHPKGRPGVCALLPTLSATDSVEAHAHFLGESLRRTIRPQAIKSTQILVVVDALERCLDPSALVDALIDSLRSLSVPVKVLLTSRSEGSLDNDIVISVAASGLDAEKLAILPSDYSEGLEKMFESAFAQLEGRQPEKTNHKSRNSRKYAEIASQMKYLGSTAFSPVFAPLVRSIVECPTPATTEVRLEAFGAYQRVINRTAKAPRPAELLPEAFKKILAQAVYQDVESGKADAVQCENVRAVLIMILCRVAPLTLHTAAYLLGRTVSEVLAGLVALAPMVTANAWLSEGLSTCFKGGEIQFSLLGSEEFEDFITMRQSTVPRLHISLSDAHASLATRCFQIMNQELAPDSDRSWPSLAFELLSSDPQVRNKISLYSSAVQGLMYAAASATEHVSDIVVADANLKHAVAQFVDASLLNWARALVALGNVNALTSGLRELIKCFNVEVTC
jgi:hypothetical protein